MDRLARPHGHQKLQGRGRGVAHDAGPGPGLHVADRRGTGRGKRRQATFPGARVVSAEQQALEPDQGDGSQITLAGDEGWIPAPAEQGDAGAQQRDENEQDRGEVRGSQARRRLGHEGTLPSSAGVPGSGAGPEKPES